MESDEIAGPRNRAVEWRRRMPAWAGDVVSEADRPKLIATLVVVLAISAVVWPLYRKFFVNEWWERFDRGQSVVFIVECPSISARLKCGDRYTLSFTKDAGGKWCSHVRKNEDPEEPARCGINIDERKLDASWRYVTVGGVQLHYHWRGRVVTGPSELAGWLVTPEIVAMRHAHPLAIR